MADMLLSGRYRYVVCETSRFDGDAGLVLVVATRRKEKLR